MGRFEKDYPPYLGCEPYVFFCFSGADKQRVRPVLEFLYSKGCRVWYKTGKAKNKKEYDAVSGRIAESSLAVLFLSESACSDTSLKNDIKFSLRNGTNIIILRADPISSNLSLGLPEELPSVENEEDIIRAEGFHAGLLDPAGYKKNNPLKATAAVLLALSVLVAGWAGIKISRGEPLNTKPAEVTELHLKSLPDSPEDLKKYPSLEKLVVPQSLAAEALERFDGYVIVLAEG